MRTIHQPQRPLELSWNSKDDILMISTTSPCRLQITKRNVLCKIVTVFDLYKFISPFVVIIKMMLQELLSCGYGWDHKIQDELAVKIVTLFNHLKLLSTIVIL